MSRSPRGPNRFRERELARILRAGRSAGAKSARVVCGQDGKIIADFDFSGGVALDEHGDDASPSEDLRKLI